jgi:ABC-type transporter Mla subunit MlaD
VEDNDDTIIRVAERFDDFTSTLLTREGQLAQVLDDFAVVADVLAEEREEVETLIRSLADLSGAGLDLVSEHAVRLRTDVAIVQRLTESIDQNLGGVQDLLRGTAQQVDGFIDAFNPELRALNLRNSFSPLVQEALLPLFDEAGIPLPCLPVDVACAGPVAGLDATAGVEADLPRPTTPVDDILELLGAPTATDPAPVERDDGSVLSSFLGTFLGVRP